MIIEGFRSGKKIQQTIRNLIGHQADIDKICLYAKNSYKVKYQLLINKHRIVDSKHCNDSEGFIKYFDDMDNIYQNIDEYNPDKKLDLV